MSAMDTLPEGKSTDSQNSAFKFREFMEPPKPIPGGPRAQGWEARSPLPLHQAWQPAAVLSAGSPCPATCSALRTQEGSARRASTFSFSFQALHRWLCLTQSLLLTLPGLCLLPFVLACPSLSSESFCHPGTFFHGAAPLQALGTALRPFQGASESCWEQPLGRSQAEQKLLTCCLIPSRGGTVRFSQIARR